MKVAGSSTVSRRVCEVVGVASFGIALSWLIALLTYEPADPTWFFNTGSGLPPANFIGPVGAFLAELSFQLLGYAAYLIPGLLAVVGWHYFWCCTLDAGFTKLIGAVLLFSSVSSFLSLAFGNLALSAGSFQPGGYLGQWLSTELTASLNPTGSIIVILVLLFLAIILSTQVSLGRSFAAAARGLHGAWARWIGSLSDWRAERQRERQRREVIAKHTKRAAASPDAKPSQAVAAGAANHRSPPEPLARAAAESRGASGDETPLPAKPIVPVAVRRTPVQISAPSAPDFEPAPRVAARRASFTLPPVALLDAPKTERKIDERELMESAHLLEEKCREFAAEGSVVQIHPGPIVTTFEFKPDAGVKYSKITGLADDLSLALQAESVLIERIPGKSTVGIQIPNHTREQISLRDLLESEAYRRSPSRLCLALGKTIHGEPFIGDLAVMPHLLIAGSTGTGKSVAINAMLTGILYRSTPADVRLILIDPKRLELKFYEDIPHLLTPVVVDPKQAANALGWAVREMEDRYKTLAAEGVRNIEQYNRNVREVLEERGSQKNGEELKPLPYVVVVIDELADLMMVASNEVEESIARLAQMARAVGIHLILATQRPSVDVITGLIKANFPARISFRVSSKVDSRTILDGNGAEQLLGKGDMLYLPPASSRLIRLHGPYISEQESARLAAFLRKQGKP
jgi:DNA segregation ATPase FtsK/SpoIIIE, S-DNA-T family